jgi:hypothetical protein
MPGLIDRLLGRGRDATTEQGASDEVAPGGRPSDTPGSAAASGGIYTSTLPGTLPASDDGRVGEIPLPPGVLVAGEEEGDEPVIWISSERVAGIDRLWSQLAAAFPETGLWPLVMELEIDPKGMSEIVSPPTAAGIRSFREVLAGWSSEVVRANMQVAAPSPDARPAGVDQLIRDLSGHLGLVAVSRPADTLAATGWMGAANYDQDPGDLSTLLRSWEDRFDAYVVGLGWDTVHVAVGRPPRDRKSARALAAEHYAFCLDNIEQGVGDVDKYAETLIDAPVWQFWWD